MRNTSNDSETTYGLRVLARGSDGRMFSFAIDGILAKNLADEVEEALRVMRDRETWFPEETFRDDARALFSWRHLGWGFIEPVEVSDALA